MELNFAMVERLRRLFYRRDPPATHAHGRAEDPGRFERFRRRRGVNWKPADVQVASPAFEPPKVEEDAYLLFQETEFFGRRPPDGAAEPEQRPIGPHLWVVSIIAWLFTIDPVFRALTPRSFSGIPAPQLLAVLLVMPLILFGLMWFWARGLSPRVRVFVRTQIFHWKRWLCLVLAALWVRSALG